MYGLVWGPLKECIWGVGFRALKGLQLNGFKAWVPSKVCKRFRVQGLARDLGFRVKGSFLGHYVG